jgi:hypothetical protein
VFNRTMAVIATPVAPTPSTSPTPTT